MLIRILVAVLLISPALVAQTAPPRTAGMSEFSIRRIATKKPLPVYPVASILKKSAGVAVAAIASDLEGRITNVTVLEAPDDDIASAVRTALQDWVIPPVSIVGRPERIGLYGKVTFYFRIAAGRGIVANPEDLPGGPKPEPASGPPPSGPGARGMGAAPAVVIGGHTSSAAEIGEAEMARLAAATTPMILDVRERPDFRRRHRERAVNIPLDELSVRSWLEIDRTGTVVIDCSYTETFSCHNAAQRLIEGPKPAQVLILIP